MKNTIKDTFYNLDPNWCIKSIRQTFQREAFILKGEQIWRRACCHGTAPYVDGRGRRRSAWRCCAVFKIVSQIRTSKIANWAESTSVTQLNIFGFPQSQLLIISHDFHQQMESPDTFTKLCLWLHTKENTNDFPSTCYATRSRFMERSSCSGWSSFSSQKETV